MYSGPGECSVEVCLVCWPVLVSFLSVDLQLRFAKSWGMNCLWGNSVSHIFVEPAVVVGHACISKSLTTPCHTSWQMPVK